MLLQSIYFSRFLPNRPCPLSSFGTHARWQPVTQSAQSWLSYGKIEDCDQSRLYRAVSWLSKYNIGIITRVILPSLPRHQLGQITSKIFPSSSPFTYLRVIFLNGISFSFLVFIFFVADSCRTIFYSVG